MTQEFHISVTPVGDDEYLVRTERVAPGVPLAEEQVSWPVENWLNQARQLMHDPLLSVLQGEGAYPAADLLLGTAGADNASAAEKALERQRTKSSMNLVALGQQLYNALFQGTIRDSWMTAQGIAQHRREVLRLRLGLKGDRLARLPWEVLHTAERNSVAGAPRPIATGTDVLFSRYQSSLGLSSATPGLRELIYGQQQPLKILMAIAAPTDQEHLELKREALHLQEELSGRSNGVEVGAGRAAEIQLTILDQPDREQLTQALEQGQFQVLHYAGHSNLGVAGGNLYLVNRKTGLTEVLSGDDLAGLLVNNGIRMAVFNSCRSAHTATSEIEHEIGEQSLADALVRRGIPGVLAMAERIPDDVALTLTQLFYRNLKQGYPVDLSLSRARQGLISAYGSRQLYWALPILYLHPEFDAQLVAATNVDLYNASLDMPGARWRSPNDRGTDLLQAPDPYDSTLDPEEAIPAFPTAARGAEADQFFSEDEDDLTDFVDDLEWDDDLASEEDSALVAELIEQLSQSHGNAGAIAEEPFTPASPAENLLAEPEPRPYLDLPSDVPTTPRPNTVNGVPANSAVDPQVQRTFSDLERHLVAPNDPTATIATARQAIQVNPNDVDAYNRLGLALYQQGNLSEAIAAYKRALQINPSLAEVYSNLALALYKQGNLREAQAAYQQAISQTPFANSPQAQATGLFTRLRGPRLQRTQRRSRGLWWLAGASLVAIALLGVWFFRNREPQLSIPTLPESLSVGANSSFEVDPVTGQAKLDLKTASTSNLTAAAIDYLGHNQLIAGQQVVTELLDRVALPQASAALAAVPAQAQDQPAISFLRGRFAWQAIQTGNQDYSVDDARRYWETAVQRQEELGSQEAVSLPLYYNALGFAYYAEGNLNRANQAWFKALYLLEEQQTRKEPTESSPQPQAQPTASSPAPTSPQAASNINQDALTTYAGLALVLAKSAQTQPPEQQANLRNEAAKLYQKVMAENPVAFQPEALSQNWLWTESAIADWQALTQLKAQL